MRTIIIAILALCVAITATAQTPAPSLPKIRLQTGFLTSKWEIGDKDVSEKEVENHLKTHNNDAYYKFRRGRTQDRNALVWSLVGLTGAGIALAGYANDNTNTLLLGDGILLVGSVGTLVCILGGSAKKDRAVNIYNKAAGY